MFVYRDTQVFRYISAYRGWGWSFQSLLQCINIALNAMKQNVSFSCKKNVSYTGSKKDFWYYGLYFETAGYIGVARIISWGEHRFGRLLAPLTFFFFLTTYYLNFSDEDCTPLTSFFAHFCMLVCVICVLSYETRMV